VRARVAGSGYDAGDDGRRRRKEPDVARTLSADPDWKADLRVLSLGAGVQSSTLLYLAAEGVIEDVDAAIFADTQWEPKRVYEHLDRLRGIADGAGIDLRVVTAGDLRERVVKQNEAADAPRRPDGSPTKHWVTIPLHTVDAKGRAGMIRRVCTNDYKIRPIRREVRKLMAERDARTVDQIIGISLDEFQRMRDSDVRFIRHVYPLVDLRMTRENCLTWIREREDRYPMPAKSACIACPFHDDHFWRYLKNESPDEFAEAVEFDKLVRAGGPMGQAFDGEAFVHRSRQPLDLVDLRTPEERGQTSLFGEDEGFGESCDGGVCGV
jgi:hypothetical protein